MFRIEKSSADGRRRPASVVRARILQHIRPTRKPSAPPVHHMRNLSNYDFYDDCEYAASIANYRRLFMDDDEEDIEPALAYLQRNTGQPMKAPHQRFSSQNNAYGRLKVCSSGMFTGFYCGCEGCTNTNIEDHKRAIICFEA